MRVLHVGEYVQGGVATYIRTLLDHPEYPDIEDFLICADKTARRIGSCQQTTSVATTTIEA